MRVTHAHIPDANTEATKRDPKFVLEKWDFLRVILNDGGRLDVRIEEDGVSVQSLGLQIVVYPKVGNVVEIKEIPKEDR